MNRTLLQLVVMFLAAVSAVAQAATPGPLAEERRLALELQKRLIAKRIPAETATNFARVYLRRAHVLDPDVAESLLDEFAADKDNRLDDREQLEVFAAGLDALVRDCPLAQVKSTYKDLFVPYEYRREDKLFFLRAFLGVASRGASPAVLMQMTKAAGNAGMVGARRRDLMGWVVAQLARGEDPVYIQQIYDVTRKVTPSINFQRDFLEKCYRGVRLGVPPSGLAAAVARLAAGANFAREIEGPVDDLFARYTAGATFEQAVEAAVPAQKPPQK